MYLFFDTETTGLPKSWSAPATDLSNWPRLVQLAWIQCDEKGLEVDRKDFIIKPEGFTIPIQASRIHGISHDKATAEGTALPIVLTEFAAAASESRALVAHNLSFDENVLKAELIRADIPEFFSDTTNICTMNASTDYCKLPGKHGYKWPTLHELYFTLFGSKFEGAHNAAIDVGICAKCFFELQRLSVILTANSPGGRSSNASFT